MGSTNTCIGQSECQNKESKEESVSKSVPIACKNMLGPRVSSGEDESLLK